MRKRNLTILVECVLLSIFASTMVNYAVAQTQVNIVVKADSLYSMNPTQLYSDTDYVLKVQVLDQNGLAMTGTTVTLAKAGGDIQIVGSSSSTTDSNGLANLSVKFDKGGVVRLLEDDNSVTTITVLYGTVPVVSYAFPVLTLLILGVILAYAGLRRPHEMDDGDRVNLACQLPST